MKTRTKKAYVLAGFLALVALFPLATSVDGASYDVFSASVELTSADPEAIASPMLEVMDLSGLEDAMTLPEITDDCPFAETFTGLHALCEAFTSDIAHD